MSQTTNLPLSYKGYPLLRKDNIIFYGNPEDQYIIMLQVLESTSQDDLSVSGKVAVQLQLTDPNASAKDRIVKGTQKEGLYNAMDIAYIWLNRAVTGKN